MSGITPILDTLLHQVLGKRVDTPPPRELFEPVRPLVTGAAPRALQGDSQLDTGRATTANPHAGVGESPARPTQPTNPVLSPASTATHFSSAARTIADILVKFPAPPPVIQPAEPLMQNADSANPALVATRLQHSIESSGLFYESHLARWYRGEIASATLAREPQMWRFQTLQPLPGGSGGAGLPAGTGALGADAPLDPRAAASGRSVLPGTAIAGRVPPTAGATPVAASNPTGTGATAPGQGGAFAVPAHGAEGPSAGMERPLETSGTLRAAAVDAIDDTLQGIIRHQLELLVTPTLRWEGDIWSGLFMALTLQLPETLDERAWGGDEERREGEEDPVWYSQISLRLSRLGELDVQMHLRKAAVTLTLESDSEACLAALAVGREALMERLRRCGLDDVRVNVLPRRDDEREEGA